MDVDDRVVGHRQPLQLIAGPAQIELSPVEVHVPHDEVALVTLRRVVERADPDVFRLAFEHGLGIGQRSPAPPLLHQPRVAGGGQRAFAEVGTDVDRVGVNPADIALRLRQAEPTSTNSLFTRSNSRTTLASAPPLDSCTSASR